MKEGIYDDFMNKIHRLPQQQRRARRLCSPLKLQKMGFVPLRQRK